VSFVDLGLRRRFQNASTTLAVIFIALGVTVLIGWRYDIDAVKSISLQFASMKPNTAVGISLMGLGAIGLRFFKSNVFLPFVGVLLAGLGAVTMSQDLFGWNLHIDELLFRDDPDSLEIGPDGRMSPLTAAGFILYGVAMIIEHRMTRAAQILTILVGLVGYLIFSGYMFGLARLFRLESFSAMAAHTSIVMLFAPAAFMFARPEAGLARSFIQNSTSGRLMRRLIPTSLVVPLICGGLVQLGEELGWFSERVGETLITVFSAVSFSLLAWWLARTVESHLVERAGFQKSLGRAGRELDRRKRELEQFAFTISHDLKSPLVSIRGFLGLMQKDIQDGRIEDAIDSANEVGDAAGHMNDIIDGILVYSRLGRIDEDPTEIDVEELMYAIVDLHRPQSDEANAAINVKPDVPSCFGYQASIRRALDNLYTNALKYAGAEGRPKIELGGFTVDGECHYYVKDNGPGIAPEYHDKVFELFHRLDTDKSGTGLGLASVAKIAEVHQGRAWVESTPGRGATFVIAVPCDGTDLKGVD